jgi:hypothetical protein
MNRSEGKRIRIKIRNRNRIRIRKRTVYGKFSRASAPTKGPGTASAHGSCQNTVMGGSKSPGDIRDGVESVLTSVGLTPVHGKPPHADVPALHQMNQGRDGL